MNFGAAESFHVVAADLARVKEILVFLFRSDLNESVFLLALDVDSALAPLDVAFDPLLLRVSVDADEVAVDAHPLLLDGLGAVLAVVEYLVLKPDLFEEGGLGGG